MKKRCFKSSLALMLITCVLLCVGCTGQKSAYVQRVDTYSSAMEKTAETVDASLKSHAALQNQVTTSRKMADTIIIGTFDPDTQPITTPVDPEAKIVIKSAINFLKAYGSHLAKLNGTKDVTDKNLKAFAVSLSELDENADFKALINDENFAIDDGDIKNVVTGIRTLSHYYIDHKIYKDLPALASEAEPTIAETIDFLIKINDGLKAKTNAQYISILGDKEDTIDLYLRNSDPKIPDNKKTYTNGFAVDYDRLEKLIAEYDQLTAEKKASLKQFDNTKKAMEKLKENFFWLTNNDIPKCTKEQLGLMKDADENAANPTCYDPREILVIWAKAEEALDFRKTVLKKN